MFTLHQGDCLEVMAGMEAGSVDAVVTDPPFFLPAQHYAARKDWARSLSDLSILEHFYRDVYAELRRVIRPGGHLLSFCDSQSYPVFYVSAYRDWPNLLALVWDKGRIGMGTPWRNAHELILACWDSGATLTGTQGTVLRDVPIASSEREHPAEKPVALMRRLVSLVAPKHGTVLDPFTGSGTTGVACIEEGRHFIGIEREAEYVEIARRRIEAAAAQTRLPV